MRRTKKIQTLRARVRPELKQRVWRVAEALHSDESQLVRTAVLEYLDRAERKEAA